jgi:hypothetical protein
MPNPRSGSPNISLSGQAPQTPAQAFERYVEIVRKSPDYRINVQPQELMTLILPFLANPQRHGNHVAVLVMSFALALLQVMKSFFGKPGSLFRWVMNRFIPRELRWNQYRAGLQELERLLFEELKPGSVYLHLKPTRYLETPAGYGERRLHRYRIQTQLAVEPTKEDTLAGVAVELTLEAAGADVTIDAISPQAGFSAVGVRNSAGIQLGEQETVSTKAVLQTELLAVPVKVKSEGEMSRLQQQTKSLSVGAEQTLSRVEQYLMARVAGHRVYWRALAGVGPLDVGGIEYSVDILAPEAITEVAVKIRAGVDWQRAGTIPAELNQSITLPRP